jgi:hypothetical protein
VQDIKQQLLKGILTGKGKEPDTTQLLVPYQPVSPTMKRRSSVSDIK